MLRYKSTGAARCSAMAVRAIRARMPAANTRPPREQKIHAGKKEPKMLYSGGWEQPTNASGASSDNPASGGSEVVRRRSHALDSVFKSGRPHAHRSFVLTTSSIRTERTSRAIRPPWTPSVLCFDYAIGSQTESIGRRYRLIRSYRVMTLKIDLARAHEDNVHQYFRIDQYVRPIDSAPHFCLNRS
jgi:hypothetical protein